MRLSLSIENSSSNSAETLLAEDFDIALLLEMLSSGPRLGDLPYPASGRSSMLKISTVIPSL
jgi:hypothetical protein